MDGNEIQSELTIVESKMHFLTGVLAGIAPSYDIQGNEVGGLNFILIEIQNTLREVIKTLDNQAESPEQSAGTHPVDINRIRRVFTEIVEVTDARLAQKAFEQILVEYNQATPQYQDQILALAYSHFVGWEVRFMNFALNLLKEKSLAKTFEGKKAEAEEQRTHLWGRLKGALGPYDRFCQLLSLRKATGKLCLNITLDPNLLSL